MEKILITGAGGFIGQPTVEEALTKPDWEIHVVSSGRHAHSFPEGVTVHQANLSDAQDCEKLMKEVAPDRMIHLAWGLEAADYEYSETNLVWLETSLRLLREFYQCGGRRFVFCGSGSEYCKVGGLFTEDVVAVKRTVYGTSKASFEMIAKNFCEVKNIEFASARCFSVYGENDKRKHPAIPASIQAFTKGEPFLCKAPNNVWDFIHVKDVAAAIIQIAGSDYCGAVNVGTGKPHLMRNVFTSIAQQMNSQELLSFDENSGNITMLVADTTILNDVIGYHCQISFEEGLKRTITWWESQFNN